MKHEKAYFIAGGGTGGHVFPALAIAKALQKKEPEAKIFFVGTRNGLEVKLVPAAGFELFLLPVGKLNMQGRWIEKIKTILRMPLAFLMSARLLLRHPPQAVLGVGGYASGPFVLVSSLLGFPTAIWEPNAFPGLTNRWLARFVGACFVLFDEAATHLKAKRVLRLGMPIRQEIEEASKSAAASAESAAIAEDSNNRPFRILCTGGSQGARAINTALLEVLKAWRPSQDGVIEVVHQIGSTDWGKLQGTLSTFGPWMQAKEFINDMPEKLKWADLVIGRAGASTVAELSAFAKASLLIPLPGAEAHQEKNALALAQSDAAVVLLQKDLTPERLKSEIIDLMNSKAKRAALSRKINSSFEPLGSTRIAEALLNLRSL